MSDFYFPDGHALDLGSPSIRFENNKRAILLAKELAAANRAATFDEQMALSKYVGWGDSRLSARVRELKDILTEEELRLASASSLNAHYTSLEIVRAMWDAVERLNFPSRIRVLDPAAGIGHFKSLTPVSLRDRTEWTEIELDPCTASILKALHPSSKIFVEGYESANLPDGYFDLAITNVPFGDYGVSSKKLPRSLTHPIHDFFFANTWSLLKAGGVMFYITSRYTMDKESPHFRAWLAERFDLLSAVRLPETAFLENAGTKVITDILLLRKRAELQDAKSLSWVETIKHDEISVNRHFIEHPEQVIGLPALDGKMYRSDGYTVHAAGLDIPAELRRMYASLQKLEFAPVEKTAPASVVYSDDVALSTQASGNPITQDLMGIHDAAKKLIRAETRGDVNAAGLRNSLNQLYDAFVFKHGIINDKANLRLLKNGAELPFLKALEKNDTITGAPLKADIFFQSTVRTAMQVSSVSASDALLLSLDRTGHVDMRFIAGTAGVSEHEAAKQLRGAVYLDPQSQRWQTSEQYLSGNVREKLRQAKAAAQYDPRFQENVAALESAIPLTVQVKDIRAPLGAGWIPTETISDFLLHLLKDGKYKVTYIEPLAAWEVEAENLYFVSKQLLSQKWGTSRTNAVTLVTHGLNSHEVVIYDNMGEERVVNQTETVAAQAKLLEIKEEFERWLWSDPQRAAKLSEAYNEKFNSVRVAKYDGSHLSTPGLSTAIKLRSNQRDAAWRVIQNQATLIGHEVGMGKTLTAIVAAMESKRLGFTRKAMIVVPNHTLVNWQAVMQIAYPGANMLIPSPDDLSKEKRGEFLSRVATNDWDLILVPFSSFKLLPISTQAKRDFYAAQIAELEEYLYEEKAQNRGKTRAQKEIEKALKRFDKKMRDLDLFDKDSEKVVTFEELGVDFLTVDEFHCLPYESKILTDQGLIPIGEIVAKHLPVLVESVDLKTGEIKWKPITGWFNNPQSAPMVLVEHERGFFKCTANHKVWTEEEGYVEAGKLTKHHTLKNLPNMQKAIYPKQWTETSSLFQGMSKERRIQNRNKTLCPMRTGVYLPIIWRKKQQQKAILRKFLRGKMEDVSTRAHSAGKRIPSPYVGCRASSSQGKTQSRGVSPHESKQPQPIPRMAKENVSDYVWSHVPSQRRKWKSNPTARSRSQGTQLANGIRNCHRSSKGPLQISTQLLQSGYCGSCSNVGNRNRWRDAQYKEVEVSRSPQDGGTERSRVVSVTFLESASGFRPGIGTQRDTRVYCLEVEETHNFFADGVLVSNCYKNLYFTSRMTRIAGISNTDSQRAFDMFIKSKWLLGNGGKFVGLTGTPVTNTIAEMFTMQRYFQMDTLKSLGLSQFDAWARQFALAEPGLEMTPDGAGFRMNTRFRKFVNMGELMQVWLQVADMRRVDSAEIERPELYKGKPVKVVSFAGKELQDFVASLAARAEKVRGGKVRPDEDNMLMITSDGRKAAADLSLVVPAAPNADMPKIDGLVSLVKVIRDTTNPVKGTQLIFCDLAVPKARAVSSIQSASDPSEEEAVETEEEVRLTDNLYSEIRWRLTRLGVPLEEIAFIHDARSAKGRADLFNAVNNGEVRILIGSNEKMGTGLNVQERLIAVHHLTPPWRPGDLEQQLGRMVRQGNLFTQVFQFVHVLSGSFDGFTWQLLENKAAFIAQIMSGSMTDREVDDIGEAVLTFSEIKALASGNPKIMRKITLEAEWQRMKSLRDAWKSTVSSLKGDMRFKQSGLAGEKEKAQAYREAVRIRDEATKDEFSITLNEVFGAGEEVFTKREEAGRRLKVLAAQAAQKVARGSLSVPLGQYRGHVIFGSLDKHSAEEPQPYLYFEVHGSWLHFSGADDVGITRSMDLVMKNMDKVLAECEATIAAWERDLASYEVELQKPWEHEAKFKSLEEELLALEAELMLGHTKPASKKLRARDSVSEKEEIVAEVQALMSDPAAKKLADKLCGVASREVIEALLALQSLMTDSETLARFDSSADIPITTEALEEIGAEIKRLQALYDWGKAVQLSLFGDPVAPPARRRRK